MDQNGLLLEIETSKKSNKYYLLFKKTLPFLVPVSLLSFLLTYVSGFSFIFTYNFHFSTLVFPLFSRALERKYMFLICNGILAFLAKTLSFNSSSSPSATDFIHDESMKNSEENVKLTSESSVIEEVVLPSEEARLSVQYPTTTSGNVALKGEEEEEEEEEEEIYATRSKSRYAEDYKPEAKAPKEENEGRLHTGSSFIIESEDIYNEAELDDDETDEIASLLGSSAAEGGNEVNLNTEELNQKFEEFIRKMKEEIRIEAQQQLVVA